MSETQGLPAVNFSSFVTSLAQTALMHLGELPDPTTGTKSVELAVARHTIDALGMLEDKTQGNLDDGEAKLLSSLLYELRSKFVAASRAQG
jgi:hypothetical protein